jgi:hypothetical protein
MALPKRSNKPLFIVAGAGAALVLGLVIFVVSRGSHSSSSSPSSPTAATSAAILPAATAQLDVRPQALPPASATQTVVLAKEETAPALSAPSAAPPPAQPGAASGTHTHGTPSASKPTAKEGKPAPKPGGKSEPDFGY